MGATTERGRSWLEERRRQAWELKTKGWPQNKIAEALGVTEGAVSQWLKRGRRGGVEALRARKRGGSRPELGAKERCRLLELLERGAEAFGFEGEVWTLPRIAELIRREFGVHHHPAHVSKILHRCGWSPQKPTIRAAERDEAEIAAWKEAHRSDAQKAEKRGETLAFLDESGVRLLPTVVRTWAPKARSPILRPRVRRRHLSVISAVTHDGRLYVGLQDRAYKSQDVVHFLKHLLRWIPGKLVVYWDRSNIHGGPPMQDFLASPEGTRIRVVRLPAYAPELNPDELVWRQLKRIELRNLCCCNISELAIAVRRAVGHIQRRRALLAAFVRHARSV